MDDLLGEDWQKPAATKPPPTTNYTASAPNPSAFASNYSSFRASPQIPASRTGTTSPLNISRPSSTVNGTNNTSASAGNDSFRNLLSLKSQKAGASGLSMQERQKQLLEEKRKRQEQQSQLWDTLGSGRGTSVNSQPSPAAPLSNTEDEDDILAAFNRDAPVNKASYFAPPPSSGVTSGRSTPAQQPPTAQSTTTNDNNFDDNDHDDPFGLGSMPSRSNGHVNAYTPATASSNNDDDDDILGDLGKPVEDLPPARPDPVSRPPQKPLDTSSSSSDDEADGPPQDRQLAELVDMGFPADTARIALSENGGNVQSAVGWLLQQAHEESRQKIRDRSQQRPDRPQVDAEFQSSQRAGQEQRAPWAHEDERSAYASRQRNNGSPANGEKDPTQVAQELGSRFLKSANSLWKASQKQMAKTLSEFQSDSDANQPKWMKDSSAESSRSNSRRPDDRRPVARAAKADLTDEAAMLDAPRTRPQKPARPPAQQQQSPTELPSRVRSPVEPAMRERPSQPKYTQQQAAPLQDRRPASRLSRQEVEDQSAQAYISPARRKRATPKPEPKVEEEVDLFSSAAPTPSVPAPNPSISSTPSHAPAAVHAAVATPKAAAPPRNVPSISPSALSTSARHRKAGGEHFKRGDYAAAHESYSSALTPLPTNHPIAIVVLSNRALTGLKTGDAKLAVTDADRALEIIGPGLGSGETIDLGAGEGTKDMKEFYGKAIMRKAEALEHLEKYTDAAAAWRLAVAAGVGGAVSLRGRDRCEKAAAPRPPAPASTPKPTRSAAPAPGKFPPSKSLGNSMQRPTISSASSAEAVKKLRQANAAAEKADDEKFALTDHVDAKLAAWRGGKADNLRALLQSMDVVLWEAAGWKKVGMSDLVMPNKVKIVYMKAIAKVHPDKIPQDATTEQQMISAAVFSTLNEAWDKFKKDNNL